MANEIYTKVKHVEYRKLIEKCEFLEKENADLKARLEKATAKSEVKTETKKGGKN